MDTEALKSFFPVLGGVLALAGGVFTFVSGRLRDADGADARAVVVRRTWEWLASGLSVGAMFVAIATNLYAVSATLFTVAFVIQAYMFLDNPSPPRRIDVLTFGLLCATFVTTLLMAATFPLLQRIIDLQGRIVEVQQELVRRAPGK